MSDVTGLARTNHFRVRNGRFFRAEMEAAGALVIEDRRDGETWYSLVAAPTSLHQAEPAAAEAAAQLCIVDRVWRHLDERDVAVFVEVNFRGIEAPKGSAIAVNANGDTRRVHLDEIYRLSADLGGSITRVES